MRRVNNPCVQKTIEAPARLVPIVAATVFSCVAGLWPGQIRNVSAQSTSGSSRTVVIKIVGPDGEPLSGVTTQSLTGMGTRTETPSTTAEVTALAPPHGKKRFVWFAHDGKKLAGAVMISGDSPGPFTAKLVPWAVVTGRVLGTDKKPRGGLEFHVQAGESQIMVDVDSFAYWRCPVGSDGSFRVERIVPGLPTKSLILERAISFGHAGPALKFKPGETIDVGTIVLPKVSIPAGTKGVIATAPPPPEWHLAKFDETKANAEYKIDFRGEGYDVRWLRIDAPGGAVRLVKPEKTGLRLTVPAGLGQAVTIATKFGVGGDFEITGTFEALSNVHPDVGWGMGPELLIKPQGGWDKFASAGRFFRPEATVYSLVHGYKVEEEKKYDANTIPVVSRTGRFRLIRTGTTLHFQVAEGEKSEFVERFATEYGPEPLEFVRLAAVTGGSQKMVDVLWKDLTVRAEELPGFSAPGTRRHNMARTLGWLIAAALAVAAAAAVIWWRAAARRRDASTGSKVPAKSHAGSKPSVPDLWDEATLARMEEAASAFAAANPSARSCGNRPRFQFSLRQGKLHGPFIAWKAVGSDELSALGSTWEEIRNKLPPLYTGSYRKGHRQGTFSYYDEQGLVSHRRYGDGRPIGTSPRGEPVSVLEGSEDVP